MPRRYGWLLVVALIAGLTGAGCLELVDPGAVDDPNGAVPDDQVLDNGETSYVEILAPTASRSIALGEAVEVRWRIAQLPASATVDVVAQSAGEAAAEQVILDGAGTDVQGSFVFDTSSLKIGYDYRILVRLYSGEAVLETATSDAVLSVEPPALSVSTPDFDQTLIPTDVVTVEWAGNYLSAGGRLELFLDTDLYYDSNNEMAVTSDLVTSSGAVQSGSIALSAADLWASPIVPRGVFMYVGVRLLKGTELMAAAYAPASVLLYDGDGLEVLQPAKDLTVTPGTDIAVVWSSRGVPVDLSVRIQFVNQSTGEETIAADGLAVDLGNGIASGGPLSAGYDYNIILELLQGETVLATRKAPGVVTVVTSLD
ncbi:MAG: hypothetical protein GXY33_16910 [Phycisphaerae bacterium]|nr:hypothetical protein [Phycisphaerae bacterium]